MKSIAILFLSAVTASAGSLDQSPAAVTRTITEPPSVPVSTVPANLDLRKRQQDVSYLTQVGFSSFIGYFPWPDTATGPNWETATCQGGVYFAVRGGYGACCNPPAGNCQFATACAGSNVVMPGGGLGTCPGGWVCQDAVVLDSRGGVDANTYFMCKEGAYTARATWYRNQFAFPTTAVETTIEDVTSTSTRTRTRVTVETETVGSGGSSTDAGARSVPASGITVLWSAIMGILFQL